MRHRSFSRWLIVVEAMFIVLSISVIWMDEFVDLPHVIFNAPSTPANYPEAILESVLLVIGGSGLILLTRVLLRRIHTLEGILPICSFCKKIRVGDQWKAVESVVAPRTDADFSHTICPDCAREHYGTLLKKRGE